MSEGASYRLPEPYRYEGIIGEGGGGIVIKAYDTELQKYVVLKKLKKRAKGTEGRIEVDILKNLNHLYLPAVHGYKSFDGAEYTVMDFVSGKSVGAMLKEGYRFSEKEVVKYAIQMCTALDYLHSRKTPIIHGDIKPDNIMIREDGDICLIDFNISGVGKDGVGYTSGYTPGYGAPEQVEEFARILEEHKQKKNASKTSEQIKTPDSDMTVVEEIADTDATVMEEEDSPDILALLKNRQEEKEKSPEEDFSGRIAITKRSDIYSLGATLYHMCAGEKINPNSKVKTVAGFGEGIVAIINRAISTDPQKRYRDAGEMLNALKNIHKGDKRYKAMQVRHFVVRMLILFLGLSGVIVTINGVKREMQEREELYSTYLSQMAAEDDDARFEQLFSEAVSLSPRSVDAYLSKISRLYGQKKYEECIEYAQSVVAYSDFTGMEILADAYYIMGNCYMELSQYEEAKQALLHSVSHNGSNVNAYEDLAIAYARCGKIDEAEKSLERVVNAGVTDVHLYLVRGEIALAKGECDRAIGFFSEYIKKVEDDYEVMRGYLLIDEALINDGKTLNNIDRRIGCLTEAARTVSLENRLMILNRLAQANIDGSAFMDDVDYEKNAIAALEEIVKMGFAGDTTYINLEILNQKIGEYEEASKYVNILIDKYPGQYQTWKRAAFLEIAIQGEKPEEERNYFQFKDYYDRAVELYNQSEGRTDADMQQLEKAMQSLIEGNWFNVEEAE